jgi:hypothetical protein
VIGLDDVIVWGFGVRAAAAQAVAHVMEPQRRSSTVEMEGELWQLHRDVHAICTIHSCYISTELSRTVLGPLVLALSTLVKEPPHSAGAYVTKLSTRSYRKLTRGNKAILHPPPRQHAILSAPCRHHILSLASVSVRPAYHQLSHWVLPASLHSLHHNDDARHLHVCFGQR